MMNFKLDEALALQGKGRFLEAKEIYEHLLPQSFDNIQVTYNAGVVYQVLNEYDKAERLFKRTLEIETSEKRRYWAGAHYHLGEINLIKGRIGRAKREFELAVEINPEHRNSKRHLNNFIDMES
jgi:tetratricopeptide (TPR) repeat protein